MNQSEAAIGARQRSLEAQLRKHIEAERYFEESGRTFRKSRFRLWFNRTIKPPVLAALFRVLGVYARGRRNALQPVVRRVTFSFPDLPCEFDGYEILQISDLHIDEMDGLTEALTPLVEPLRPDLCVLTGDYRWEITGPCDRVYPRLDAIVRSVHARHGTLAILGNHDPSEIAFHLEGLGVRMLVNEALAVKQRDAELWIAGTDDQFDYRAANLDAALAEAPAQAFTILLTHAPQLYKEASERGVHLYICGHTHGGQLRLPLIGAIKKNANVPRMFVQGEWSFGGTKGYTSQGAGCSTLPVRFNCPPEVTLLRLVRG